MTQKNESLSSHEQSLESFGVCFGGKIRSHREHNPATEETKQPEAGEEPKSTSPMDNLREIIRKALLEQFEAQKAGQLADLAAVTPIWIPK